jgi:protein bicaudal D
LLIVCIKFQLLDAEQRSMLLESDISILSKLAAEAGSSFETAQNNLQNMSDELAQLYHHVCTVNGETPSRVSNNILIILGFLLKLLSYHF